MSAQNNSRSNNEATDSHVAGGYKATLSNEKSSDEAKRHAQEMLDKAGVDANERSNNGRSNNEATDNHIIGGYRATLSNEKSSEEAKKHAREMLEKAGVDADARPSLDNKLSQNEATDSHVIGGYRATLANEKSSEEAKKHAREMLEKAGVNPDERASETGRFSNNEATDSHVIGGYRATLANEKSSEEAKKHAREMLEKAGVNPDERADSTDEKRGLKRSTDDVKAEDKESGKGKQGFASMPKEKVQEIASKGGKTQNAGEEPSPKKSKSEETEYKSNDSDKSDSGKGKQGFASMPKEKVQEIASKGGRTQHAGEEASEKGESKHSDSNKSEKSESKSESDKSDSGKGKQGFASMPKEKVQEIASKGGRTQHAGEGASEKGESKDSESRSESDKSDTGKGKQGFASMDKEKVKEIASKGGRTQQAGEPAAVKNQ